MLSENAPFSQQNLPNGKASNQYVEVERLSTIFWGLSTIFVDTISNFIWIVINPEILVEKWKNESNPGHNPAIMWGGGVSFKDFTLELNLNTSMRFIRCKVTLFCYINRKICTTVPLEFCGKHKKFKNKTPVNSVKSPKWTKKLKKYKKLVFLHFFMIFMSCTQGKNDFLFFQKTCFRVCIDMFNIVFSMFLRTFHSVSQVW